MGNKHASFLASQSPSYLALLQPVPSSRFTTLFTKVNITGYLRHTWEMSLNSASHSLPRGLLIGPPPAIIF